MTIANIDNQQFVDGMNAAMKNTLMELLDIVITEVDDKHLTLEMPITSKTHQPFGLLHGGVNMVLAETAASSHAGYGLDFSKVIPVGIEINGSHLRSATDGTARAIATVVRRSRSLIVHQIDIFHIESGNQLCTARVTNFYKKLGE